MSDLIKNGKVFNPIEYKVLVLPDDVEETNDSLKRAKELGIEIPIEMLERESDSQVTGTLISVGGRAFEDFGDPKPAIGGTVYYAKYSGLKMLDDNKIEYLLMPDKDITGVLIDAAG